MDSDDLARTIGTRVRDARTARDWTLDRLAETTGLSRRAVVNVEQGSTNPSIATLLRLSEALGVGLPALVEPAHRRVVHVTRDGDGPVLWSGEHGGRAVLVAGTDSPDVHELWDWTLAPGDEHRSDAHAHGTAELLHVLEGELVLRCGDDETHLAAGDAVSFPGDVDHAYVHAGDRPTRFSLTVLEPGPGSSARGPRG